ncbi:hypothetical protein SISSUDRAFT_1067642 [Sistotremastrum suecicum HHB10207 ss-3]|uniref:Uncharacterized protein n=1 Tax=Sistotremastrum suecicum HHB10207 ss-3 TaxID=1314776 RepID=A0A165WWD6_9AGAM|nr:hypothetical protein SISSUDRAFT_1067642 [Sistotremastrum suecicum HHB10207 ss-3]
MYFTVDDTYPALNYSSSPGWHTAPVTDPNLGQTFRRTYLATQENQASSALSFTGSAIYIFGSKGPGPFAGITSYNLAQPSRRRSNIDNCCGQGYLHWMRVRLEAREVQNSIRFLFTNAPDETNNWLDIDFLTFTLPNNATTTADPGPYSSTNAAFLFRLATSTIAAASSTGDAVG